MKYTLVGAAQPMTFAAFVAAHALEIEVHERAPSNLPRYFAHATYTHVKDDCFLRGICGDGSTPESAIADLAHRFAGQLLVIEYPNSARREVRCPAEWAAIE